MCQAESPSRLLVVDDHEIFRMGLSLLLERDGGFEVAREAGTVNEALEAMGSSPPDAILLDLELPGRSGLDLLDELARMDSPPPVLVLTMHVDPALAREALRRGARGVTTKDVAAKQIVAALRHVLSGEIYVSVDLVPALLEDHPSSERPPPDSPDLSPREHEVFEGIGRGWEVGRIAIDMGISPKTVRVHRDRIREKLGLSLSELARDAAIWIESHGLEGARSGIAPADERAEDRDTVSRPGGSSSRP